MAFDAKIRLSSDTSRVHAGIAGVQKRIGSMVAAGGAAIAGMFTVGAIVSAVKNMMEFADEVQSAAERLGVTIERTQELQLAAKLANQDISLIETSFKNIEKAAQDAIGGNKEVMDSFKKLGVTETDVKSKTQDELLKMVLTGASKMDDKSNARMNLSNIVGAKGAGTLMGASMTESIVNPESMGIKPVDPATINALADLNDEMQVMMLRWKTDFMPILVKVGSGLMTIASNLKTVVTATFAYIIALLQGFMSNPIMTAFGKIFSGSIMEGFKDLTKIGENIGEGKGIGASLLGEKQMQDAKDSFLGIVDEDIATKMEDDKRRKALKDQRAQEEADKLAARNRTGTFPKGKGGSDKNLGAELLGTLGTGGASAGMGGLIGVNAGLRLSLLSEATNTLLQKQLEIQQKIADNTKPKDKDSTPPTD